MGTLERDEAYMRVITMQLPTRQIALTASKLLYSPTSRLEAVVSVLATNPLPRAVLTRWLCSGLSRLTILSADFVDGFHNCGSDFGRQRTSYRQTAKRSDHLRVIAESQELNYGQSHGQVGMILNRLDQWLDFASLGHQEKDRERVISHFPALTGQTVDRFRRET